MASLTSFAWLDPNLSVELKELLTRIWTDERSTLYVDKNSLESMTLLLLKNFPFSVWHFCSSDRGNGDWTKVRCDYKGGTNFDGMGSFIGFKRRHLWTIHFHKLTPILESKGSLAVICSERLVDYKNEKLDGSHSPMKLPFVFVLPTSDFGNIKVFPTDYNIALVQNGMVELIKNRFPNSGKAKYPLPKLTWPSEMDQNKPDDLNAVLEKLYDARYKKAKHDVVGLLKRYTELTGKKQPAFM